MPPHSTRASLISIKAVRAVTRPTSYPLYLALRSSSLLPHLLRQISSSTIPTHALGSRTIPMATTNPPQTKRSVFARRVTGHFKEKNAISFVTDPDHTCSGGRFRSDRPRNTRLGRLNSVALTHARSFFNKRSSRQKTCGVTKVTSLYQLREIPVGRDMLPEYSLLGLSGCPDSYVPHSSQSSHSIVTSRALEESEASSSKWTAHAPMSRAATPRTPEFPQIEQRIPEFPFSNCSSDPGTSHTEHSHSRKHIESCSSSSSDDIPPINLQGPTDFVLEEAEAASRLLARSLYRENARRMEQNRIAEIRAEVDASLAYALCLQMQDEVAR
jgi:hypothetical protein